MKTKRTWLFLILGLLLSSPTLSAHAQTALGGGNALDRNLGVGTGGINAPQAQTDFRGRNLLITGDVIGGRGFRGSVGYTAEADFRDRLGSNDLFDFRADSAISSPQLFHNMQTYEQLRFGQDMGLLEYRRAGSGDIASMNAQNPISIGESSTRLRLDRRLLDSSLASIQKQLVEPRVVGTTQTQDGQMLFYNASALRGIVMEHPGSTVGMIGLSTYDSARLREDFSTGAPAKTIGEPFQTQFEALLERDAMPTQAETGQVEADKAAGHTKILERIAERYANQKNMDVKVQPGLVKDLAQNYQELRHQLTGRADRPGQAPETDLPLPPGVKPRDPERDRTTDEPARALPETPSMTAPTTPGLPDPEAPAAPAMPPTTPEEASQTPAVDYAAILRHGQRIEQLSGNTRDRFNEIMASAEQKLRNGDYLSAEQRFDRALRFIPGHPLATAGTAHAQIGAGLYLSAALTLRTLFTLQPEMIDVRYAIDLLPTQKRLDAAVLRLGEHVQSESRDQGHYGMLLAYLGHQMNNRSLITQGLNVMEKADPKNPLLAVLRDVWLAPRATPEPPKPPAPEPPASPEK